MNPKVFFVTGHESWGKSKTLFYLAGNSTRRAWIEINELDVFVKHMSNDDWPQSYIDFMSELNPARKPFIVAALCPDFENPTKGTRKTLESLAKRGYKLFFWVMRYQYSTDYEMNLSDIEKLRPFGEVSVYNEKEEAKERAKEFYQFILKRSLI